MLNTQKWNYLRARGEYDQWGRHLSLGWELPPRTRRIRTHSWVWSLPSGTTSAHAENTSTPLKLIGRNRNYLRARGEYAAGGAADPGQGELPPRTRRIRVSWGAPGCQKGTTSAHAENTMGTVAVTGKPGNYLRARGEYVLPPQLNLGGLELPPRTRRIHAAY